VTVEVAEGTQPACDDVLFADGWFQDDYDAWVKYGGRFGDKDWQQEAVLGVQYALRAAGQRGRRVTVVHVIGDYTVTNPTIVGAAAMYAVWQGLGYQPLPSEVQRIEQIVWAGWQHLDALPIFD